jgi:hypothetical protein
VISARERVTPGQAFHAAGGPAVAPAVPAAAEYHDPAWLVRRAWSSYRLPHLQAVVRDTISGLQELSSQDVLGEDASTAERTQHLPDPIHEALQACSEELRDACGMAGAPVARAAHCSLVRGYISQQPLAWAATFEAALDRYRRAACTALLAKFRQQSAG